MKNTFFIIIFSILSINFLNAQENTFNQGDKVLNLGVGIGSTLYVGGYYKNTIPPLSTSFEVGIKDNLFDSKSSLGIGGYLGYASAKWQYIDYGWKYTSFIFGARGNFHYQLVENLDTYTGLMLGFNAVTAKEFGVTSTYYGATNGSGIVYSFFVGARYYFTPSIGAFAELGYGIAYLNLGVNLKF